MKIAACLFAITFLLSACQHSNSEIVAARQWKADSGYNIGDMITFSDDKADGLFISNDTIYEDGEPEALVASTTYNTDHYVMVLHSIDHKLTGRYIDKGRAE